MGATKTILSIFQTKDRKHESLTLKVSKEFSSREHSTFREIAGQFLSANSVPVESIVQATFGIAGPVYRGHSKLTNLRWELDEKELSESLGIEKVKLINDLEAMGNYIPFLRRHEQKTLYGDAGSVEAEDGSAAAIIAPGTGLGEAFLTWDGGRCRAHPSEGGHCDFAPSSEEQDELLSYLRERFGHVSYEFVCSGKGIYYTWSYFHESSRYSSSRCPIVSKVAKAEDPTPIIVRAMMKEGNDCEPCAKTLDTFISVLGAESGNLALKFLARSGVYVAGGLPKLVQRALTDGRFVRAYLNKGRVSKVVEQIPVILILTRNSASLGAAHYTLDSLEESQHVAYEPRTIKMHTTRSKMG